MEEEIIFPKTLTCNLCHKGLYLTGDMAFSILLSKFSLNVRSIANLKLPDDHTDLDTQKSFLQRDLKHLNP